MSCVVSQGVVFCQMTPLGFGLAVLALIQVGIGIRHIAGWLADMDGDFV